MRTRTRALVLLCGACLAAGCSTEEEGMPSACLEIDGPDDVRSALRSAPADVRLDGEPLSSCLQGESEGGTLRDVGHAYVQAAAGLADEAREEPEGDAATQLGYLVGATRRGAAKAQGVADELTRRLEQELIRVDQDAGAFTEGKRAGSAGG